MTRRMLLSLPTTLRRLTDIDYADTAPDVHFDYDENSNVESMTDTATTTYVYDLLD